MTVLTEDVAVGAAALRRGALVAFPTETVYGLGADASRSDAVVRIFEAKGRPPGHPLIVHLAEASLVDKWAVLDPSTAHQVAKLAEAFWPGPLTVVVSRSDMVAPEAVGGRSTIGLRVPSHPLTLELLRAFGGGVAGPSANLFGRVSPTTAQHVLDDLGGVVDVVLDGGPAHVGVESTIVELPGGEASGPRLLRPGGVSRPELEEALGQPVDDDRAGEARASGMLSSHYAPDATIELTTIDAVTGPNLSAGLGPDVGVIAPVEVAHQPSWLLPADATGYAQHLYAALRAADHHGVHHLLVVPPSSGTLSNTGLSDAILDRLTKAAAPR